MVTESSYWSLIFSLGYPCLYRLNRVVAESSRITRMTLKHWNHLNPQPHRFVKPHITWPLRFNLNLFFVLGYHFIYSGTWQTLQSLFTRFDHRFKAANFFQLYIFVLKYKLPYWTAFVLSYCYAFCLSNSVTTRWCQSDKFSQSSFYFLIKLNKTTFILRFYMTFTYYPIE